MDTMYDFLMKMTTGDFITIVSSFFGAFFAFLFFLLGEWIVSRRRKTNEVIEELKMAEEHIIDAIYYLLVNSRECENVLASDNPITVTIHTFILFPEGNGLYKILESLNVRESLIRFNTQLRIANIDIDKVNKYISILNLWASDAMKNQLEIKYQDTLLSNQQKLKENIKTLLEYLSRIQGVKDRVLAEINFTLNLLQANWFKKSYVSARLRCAKSYREKQIQKILSKYEEIGERDAK